MEKFYSWVHFLLLAQLAFLWAQSHLPRDAATHCGLHSPTSISNQQFPNDMPTGQSDEGNSTIAFPSSQVTLVRIKVTLKMNQYMGVRSHSFHVWLCNCSTVKEHLTETRRGTLQNSPWDLDHRVYFSKRQLMRNLGLLIIFYLVLTTVYFVSHVSRVFPWFFSIIPLFLVHFIPWKHLLFPK